ncbi:mitochondrial ribosome-associated GTPase 1-like [Penaeus monodon]|uniref:mitochondrial ribosome-associated GTPase 1-like n=1 Tax=Penaeus monodon TaxID=6687 RepID=UPI0018A76625|nr:mitochondrial ribosome-associated GTPase 1-like [Penaeus monodon]
MAGSVVRHGLRMRETFSIVNHSVAQWFPGHMAKGLTQMQRKLKSVDCIVEVHDARIPISGRNPLFEHTLSAIKPHMLVLNKMDLADLRHRNSIIRHHAKEGIKHVIFTNCKRPESRGIKSIIPTVAEMIKNSERLLLLINALTSSAENAAPIEGFQASHQSVCEDPKVYLLDTPGVLAPKIQDVETGLKLALAATIKDHLVGEENIADYLLYRLNRNGNHSYVKYLNLQEPTDNIQQLLGFASVNNGWKRKVRTQSGIQVIPDLQLSASKFIKGFRTGAFGPMILDDVESMKS